MLQFSSIFPKYKIIARNSKESIYEGFDIYYLEEDFSDGIRAKHQPHQSSENSLLSKIALDLIKKLHLLIRSKFECYICFQPVGDSINNVYSLYPEYLEQLNNVHVLMLNSWSN